MWKPPIKRIIANFNANTEFKGFWLISQSFNSNLISIYVIVMGIIKCEKVCAGIFSFLIRFKIKMKVFSHWT